MMLFQPSNLASVFFVYKGGFVARRTHLCATPSSCQRFRMYHNQVRGYGQNDQDEHLMHSHAGIVRVNMLFGDGLCALSLSLLSPHPDGLGRSDYS